MNIRHSNYDVIHRLAPQVKGLQSNLLIINERKRDRLEEPLVSSTVGTHRKALGINIVHNSISNNHIFEGGNKQNGIGHQITVNFFKPI